ncbi:MAG: agmatinase [Methanomassiliicoccales archaeon]
MAQKGVTFASAKANFDEAHFVIVGVPFETGKSLRPGCRGGPKAIREASHNLETYLFEHDLDLRSVPVHDMGDLPKVKKNTDMVEHVRQAAEKIIGAGKFPIFMGGEHIISLPVVQSFKDIGVISIDAHLDFREEQDGSALGGSCVMRRMADQIGLENVLPFGVRSISLEEKTSKMPNYIDSFSIHEQGIENSWKRAMNMMRRERVFLSLDIDGIDPSFAPGTGTPEPFGLSPYEVKRCINMLGERMVGFDVSEVCPACDQGSTAVLAARLVQEVLAVGWKHRKGK